MRRAAVAAGFTLIELLVVLAILGVLAAALLPNVLGASEQGEIAETEARLVFLAEAAKAYERSVRGGGYPPDSYRDLERKVKADAVNTGIEVLVLALGEQRLGRDNLSDQDASWFADTDGDRAREVVDSWGVPLAYFRSANGGYERAQQVMSPEGNLSQVRASLDPKTKKPLAAGKFQLLSAGPDGEFGSDDDVGYPDPVRS